MVKLILSGNACSAAARPATFASARTISANLVTMIGIGALGQCQGGEDRLSNGAKV